MGYILSPNVNAGAVIEVNKLISALQDDVQRRTADPFAVKGPRKTKTTGPSCEGFFILLLFWATK